jgi:hypothetical protein
MTGIGAWRGLALNRSKRLLTPDNALPACANDVAGVPQHHSRVKGFVKIKAAFLSVNYKPWKLANEIQSTSEKI